jgi:NADH-quinone oxidoreductase subunit N
MILFFKKFILIPEFFFCVSFICLILYGTILSTTLKRNRLILKPLINISILILIFSTFLFCNNFNSIEFNSNFFFNSIVIDYFSELSKIFISIFTVFCFYLFQFYLPIQKINTFEYIVIILLAVLGVFLLCSANDLLTAYLSIELQSLSFYILASYKKKSSFSINAGLKYFILGAIASCLFLFSTSLLYGITGSINLEEIFNLFNISGFFELYSFFCLYLKQITCYNIFGFCYSFDIDFEDLFLDIYFCILELSFFFEFNQLNNVLNYNFQSIITILNSYFYYSSFFYFNSSFNVIYLFLTFFFENFFVFDNNLFLFIVYNFTEITKIFSFDFFYLFESFFFSIYYYNSIFLLYFYNNIFILKLLEFYFLVLYLFSNISFLIFFCTDLLLNSFIYYSNYFLLNFFLEDSFYIYFKFFHIVKTIFFFFLVNIIIFILFLKLAVVPFNLWLPDVYEGSISNTTAFFTIIPKLSIFIFIFRFLDYGVFNNSLNFQYYILISGVFSIIYGSIIAIEERKLKSLIAFSAISNIGFSLIALSSLSYFSYAMVFCYFILYMLSNVVIWFILLTVIPKKSITYKKFNKELSNFSNFYKSNKIMSFFFSFALFSIAGIPPFIGFLAKFGIFLATFEAFVYSVSIISILGSIISIFYYLRIIKIIFFENNDNNILLYLRINSFLFFFFVGLFLLLILLFINPNILYLSFLKLTYTFG